MVSNTNNHLKGSYELFYQVKISFILSFYPCIFTDSSRGCFRVQNSCLFSLKGRGARPRKAVHSIDSVVLSSHYLGPYKQSWEANNPDYSKPDVPNVTLGATVA